ncbi:MAG: hypothetical protein HYT28_03450 [Parcubacteria group bacterium]|nr:hypothetical protein [Parcubacteria group bacterium]
MLHDNFFLIGDTCLIHVKEKEVWLYNVKTQEQNFTLPVGNYTGHVIKNPYVKDGVPWVIIDQAGEKNIEFPTNGAEVGLPVPAWKNWPERVELTLFVDDEK